MVGFCNRGERETKKNTSVLKQQEQTPHRRIATTSSPASSSSSSPSSLSPPPPPPPGTAPPPPGTAQLLASSSIAVDPTPRRAQPASSSSSWTKLRRRPLSSSSSSSSSSNGGGGSYGNSFISRLSRIFTRSKASSCKMGLSSSPPHKAEPDFHSSPAPLLRADAFTPPTSLEARSPSERESTSRAREDNTSGQLMDTTSSDAEAPPATEESFVYVWGDNSRGQVLVDCGETNRPRRVLRLAHRRIAHLCCGTMTTWMVSDSGDAWAGGSNLKGQISLTLPLTEVRRAVHLEEFEATSVRSLAAGEEHAVVVLDNGVALSYGSNEFGQLGHGSLPKTLEPCPPRSFVGPSVFVNQVVCGAQHTLVLSSTGQVFACGNGADGCLGLGDKNMHQAVELTAIPALAGVPMQQIAAGPEHSMALSLSGHIFSWGRNRKGRLGLGFEKQPVIFLPVCLKSEELPSFKHIATGPTHSVAIGPKGSLYLCGDNSDGQLGRNPEQVKSLDTFQQLPLKSRIRWAVCGDRHSVLVDQWGHLFTFGRNAEGQLGLAKSGDAVWEVSQVVQLENGEGSIVPTDLFFYAIAAGKDHTVAAAIHRPPGLCRQDSKLLTPGSARSELSLAFSSESLLSPEALPVVRLNSKLGVLRQLSSKRIAGAGGGEATILYPLIPQPQRTTVREERLSHLPSIVQKSGAVARTLLHPLQTLVSQPSLEVIDNKDQAAALIKKSRARINREAITSNDGINVPAGCSVGEILSLIESVRSSASEEESLRILKKRLGTVFSEPNRLNCSFLLPGRMPLLDIEGVEEIFDEIETLDLETQDTLHRTLYAAADTCLSCIESTAEHYMYEDQLRSVVLLLQLRFLGTSGASNVRLICKLLSIVFKLPLAGRRAFVDIVKTQCPSNVFGSRILHNVKTSVNAIIGSSVNRANPDIWRGIVLIQLLFLASVEWALEQRQRIVGLTGRSLIVGKVPLEEFVLDSISENVEEPEELARFQRYAPPLHPDEKSPLSVPPPFFGIPRGRRPPLLGRARGGPHRMDVTVEVPWESFLLLMRGGQPAEGGLPAGGAASAPVQPDVPPGGTTPGASPYSNAEAPAALGSRQPERRAPTPPPPPSREGRHEGGEEGAPGGAAAGGAPGDGAPSAADGPPGSGIVFGTFGRIGESGLEGPTLGREASEQSSAGDGAAPFPPEGPPAVGEATQEASFAQEGGNNNNNSERRFTIDGEVQITEDEARATAEVTGRPRTVFDPSFALVVHKLDNSWTFFLAHQNLCPLRVKRRVIMLEAALFQRECSVSSLLTRGQVPFFFMPVRRSHVVEDALNIITATPATNLLNPLKVIFDGEEGVDAGGLRREFFNIVVQTLFDPQYGMFVYNADARTVWFNRNTIDTDKEFHMVGVILGLALYNGRWVSWRVASVGAMPSFMISVVILLCGIYPRKGKVDLRIFFLCLGILPYENWKNPPSAVCAAFHRNSDNLLNLPFPMAVWKKLLSQPIGIDDLMDVFPDEAASFEKVLDWPEEKKDEFDATFGELTFDVQYDFFGELKSVELIEGGQNLYLTYEEREKYVDSYTRYLLETSIKQQFEAFKSGFLYFQTMLLKTLSPDELHLLVCGSATLDFKSLRKGSKYEGYAPDDTYLDDFWDILENLDLHQKKKFLRFCTGTDRVPVGGLAELGLKIQRNGGEPTDHLPTAYTCFNFLLLPRYESKAKLQRLLVIAIEQFQGFGLQ